jgi:aryl-alcohol dehydrogenase-like predicted oxidoreductase
MDETTASNRLNRRQFLQASAAAGAVALVGSASQAATGDGIDRRNERPDRMRYRVLGRTQFNSSRLVFGCGAALAGGKAVRLLERAYEQGINFFDVGYDDYYKGSERHLAPFLKRHPGDVWVVSKAPARIPGDGTLTVESARAAAAYWTGQLEQSLTRLGLDYVDAYYFMGVNSPDVVRNEELYGAFERAKTAGKVGHLGISTHENAQECLEAAIETGWYSLAMIAICPAGWYDYRKQELLNGRGTLRDLQPLLERARQAGIGLVGMKGGPPHCDGAIRREVRPGGAGQRGTRIRPVLSAGADERGVLAVSAFVRVCIGERTRRRQRRYAELQALRGKFAGYS